MELYGLISFFAVMLLLAAVPSASVGFVIVSSVNRGLPCGIAAALGIVAGDLIFVTLALLGMTALAELMGSFFAVLRYLGGAYLIWIGVGLIRSAKQGTFPSKAASKARIVGTFSAAMLLTLGDIKAILFYASLFPIFVSFERLTISGIIVIIGLTALSVGSIKTLYALLANRIASRFTKPGLQQGSGYLVGSAMIGAGGVVIAKT